jgi:hypothetical protein
MEIVNTLSYILSDVQMAVHLISSLHLRQQNSTCTVLLMFMPHSSRLQNFFFLILIFICPKILDVNNTRSSYRCNSFPAYSVVFMQEF